MRWLVVLAAAVMRLARWTLTGPRLRAGLHLTADMAGHLAVSARVPLAVGLREFVPWLIGVRPQGRMTVARYERQARALSGVVQVVRQRVEAGGERVVVLIEGPDPPGNALLARRLLRQLGPGGARLVALGRPSGREATQWFFQRYLAQLPSAGQVVLFAGSWYARAGAERVMGYCSRSEYLEFMRQVPELERMLVRSGITVIKVWVAVSRREHAARVVARRFDPVHQRGVWSDDVVRVQRWDQFREAAEVMFLHTDTTEVPWTVVDGDDGRRAALEVMRHIAGCRVPRPG